MPLRPALHSELAVLLLVTYTGIVTILHHFNVVGITIWYDSLFIIWGFGLTVLFWRLTTKIFGYISGGVSFVIFLIVAYFALGALGI